MKRIGILTAGGDTPALNATLLGAVTRANARKVEVVGFIKGFSGLMNPRMPHVRLNPLFVAIPELDATLGGTLLGASRQYIGDADEAILPALAERLKRLGIEGLVCVGGDGTLNGMQALSGILPTVLAPKTIDNDLGLNHPHEPDEWIVDETSGAWRRGPSRVRFDRERMVNYVTPGFATAVFVSAAGVERIRTTAESHRRIAVIEVMGRHSGYIALGSSFGQPDLVLIPESPLDPERLVSRVVEIYERQKNVVIVCGEGIVDANGKELGDEVASTDPSGNRILSGASEAVRQILVERIGDAFFTSKRRNESARAAIFTRKIGHTQRGGRPIRFDAFHAQQLGGHAVDLLLEGVPNRVAILQWNADRGFHMDGVDANAFRDRSGQIRARMVHPALYDAENLRISAEGIDYLKPIFANAIGPEDVEAVRVGLFAPGKLTQPYHSVNVDVNKRIRYLE